MAKCTAITRGGDRCKGIAIDSSGYCYAHHPDHAEARRRAAHKGGKRGGRGRPLAEIAEIKAELQKIIDRVISGEVERSRAAVAFQGYNVLLRAHTTELAVRDQLDVLERLERLEDMQEQARQHSDYGGGPGGAYGA